MAAAEETDDRKSPLWVARHRTSNAAFLQCAYWPCPWCLLLDTDRLQCREKDNQPTYLQGQFLNGMAPACVRCVALLRCFSSLARFSGRQGCFEALKTEQEARKIPNHGPSGSRTLCEEKTSDGSWSKLPRIKRARLRASSEMRLVDGRRLRLKKCIHRLGFGS
ncbi:hypothetical protein LX32DRAFT_250666 [Colletotrichum zoysiae]|uniref:Uncharacterized protein n=1 Tax=Colletotrichum zoysiae TaxID=1216348 RepID=A0AAD9H446_9PEZI|nr:hypothetical protein LX32DRAFT_250666 [Colletotrichum zoysiae]